MSKSQIIACLWYQEQQLQTTEVDYNNLEAKLQNTSKGFSRLGLSPPDCAYAVKYVFHKPISYILLCLTITLNMMVKNRYSNYVTLYLDVKILFNPLLALIIITITRLKDLALCFNNCKVNSLQHTEVH